MIPGTDACCILLYGDIGEYDDNVRSGDIARELLEAEALTGKVDVRINSNEELALPKEKLQELHI